MPSVNFSPTVRRLLADGQSLSAGAKASLCESLLGLVDTSTATHSALSNFAGGGVWDMARACALINLALLSPDYLRN